MGENTSKMNLADELAELTAKFEAEAALKQQAEKLLQKAFDDIYSHVASSVEAYKNEPAYKKAIDFKSAQMTQEAVDKGMDEGKAKKAHSPNNVIFQSELAALKKQPEYAKGTGGYAALAALTSKKTLVASANATQEVASVISYASSEENLTFTSAGLMSELSKVFSGKKVPQPSQQKDPEPQPRAQANTQTKKVVPQAAQVEMNTGIPLKQEIDPAAALNIDTGEQQRAPVTSAPNVAGTSLNGVGMFGAQRSNQDLEQDLKKLNSDLRKVEKITTDARQKATGNRKYKNINREEQYLANAAVSAGTLQKYMQDALHELNPPEEGAKPKLQVTDENRAGWEHVLRETKKSLNGSLSQFEGAQEAIKKSRPNRRQATRDKIGAAMLQTLTQDQSVNLDAINDALTRPSKWKSRAVMATTSLVTATLMAAVLMRQGINLGDNNAESSDNRERQMANLDPENNVIKPAPVIDKKDPELIAPDFGAAPDKAVPVPELFAPNLGGADKPLTPPIDALAGNPDTNPAMPPAGQMPDNSAGMPPAGAPAGAPAAPMADAAPKPIEPAGPAAVVDTKVEVSGMDEASLRDFVKKTVLPHLEAEYPNMDDKNPVMSVFKGDKWNVEYPQTAEWHAEAKKAKRAGDPEPRKRDNGGMLFITNSNGNEVLPVVLGNTNAIFKILNGKSYHRRDGEALILSLGGRQTAEIGEKVVAPGVSVHDDVLNGSNVRLNWPVKQGTSPKSELQYVGVPLTSAPHVDKDLAVRIVAPTPQKGERINQQSPIKTYSISLGALEPQHEKFEDTGRKTYTVITENAGTLSPGVIYKEVGPYDLGEINRYKALKGIVHYDGFKTETGYAGPLIPHQVEGNGRAAPAWIRVAPSSRQYLQGPNRQDNSTIYIEEHKEIEVAGKNPGDPREVITATNPRAYAFGGPTLPDNGPVVQKFLNEEDVKNDFRQGYFSQLMNNIADVGGLAFERIDARYDDDYSRSGRRLNPKRGEEQFEIVGRPISSVTVYARTGGYNPRTGEGVPVIRVNGVTADEETMLKLKDALEQEARKRIMDKGANLMPMKKPESVYAVKMGKILDSISAKLAPQERSDLMRLFSEKSQDLLQFASEEDTVKLALEGDEKTAARKIMANMEKDLRKGELVSKIVDEGSQESKAMELMVKNFRQSVKAKDVSELGMNDDQRIDIAQDRKPSGRTLA